jgi:hypothetical protein
MLRLNAVLPCLLWVSLAGCGSNPEPDAEEVGALRGGHEATLTGQQSLGLSDELFDFDPTLDPSKSVTVNAEAVRARATTQIPCATVALSGNTVTVTAPAAGCTTASGITFSGSLSASLAQSGTTLTVTVTFTNVVVNSTTLGGTLTLVTTDGSTFQTTFALTRNGTAVSGNLTAVGAPGQITTSGTLSSGSTSALFTTVVWKKGDCYPSAGTVAVTAGRVTTTYTFTTTTPTTGTVSTGRGRTSQLPAYGKCPAGSDGGR